MSEMRPWFVGAMFIIVFVLASELTIVFKEYVYGRLGLSRNVILSVLWMLPIVAAFWVTYFSDRNGVLRSLSLILLLGLLGPLVHLISGYFGATIDFAGVSGLKVTVQIYLLLSVLTIGVGTILGSCFRKLAS